MYTPTVHTNGTSAEELAEQQVNASRALRDAFKAMSAAAPNGRDYYPQGPHAMRLAQSEHAAALATVSELISAYDARAEVILDFTPGTDADQD